MGQGLKAQTPRVFARIRTSEMWRTKLLCSPQVSTQSGASHHVPSVESGASVVGNHFKLRAGHGSLAGGRKEDEGAWDVDANAAGPSATCMNGEARVLHLCASLQQIP